MEYSFEDYKFNYLTSLIFIFVFSFLIVYLNKINLSTELLWNKERFNLTNIKNEIEIYQNYQNISISSFNLQYFGESIKPKVSIIVPIFNQEKNLKSFYMSIYNQSLKDIEIIFINDASTDNSRQIIEEFMKKDKRIVLMRNDSTERTYFLKTKGIFKSRGEYVLFVSPDDLLLNDILKKAYETAKINDLDIVQYYLIIGNHKNNRLWKSIKCKSGIIHYPKTKDYFYNCRCPNIFDKLIRRKTFIKSMKYFLREFNDDKFDYSDDDLTFYGLSKVAESYGFLEEPGYFYNTKDPWTITNKEYRNKDIDKIFSKQFVIMRYLLNQADSNRQDKLWGYKLFYNRVYKFRNKLIFLKKHFEFINKVLDMYLNCIFFNKEEKEKLMKFKNELNRIQLKKMIL